EILPGGGRVNNLMDSDHLVKNADFLSYLRSRDAGERADGIWRELFGKADPASINNESLPALVLWAPTAAELDQARYPAVDTLSALAPGRGLAVSRSSWSDEAVMFSIHAQAYTEFKHDQADKGQFTLYAYGADLVVDSGYGNDASRERSSSGFAHNLVLVDGEPQLQGGAHARTDGWIRTYLPAAAADLVRVDQRDAYEFFYASNFQSATYRKVRVRDFVRAERTSLFVRGDFPYVVMFDDIQRDETMRTYSWLLHTATGNRVASEGRVVRIDAEKAHLELHVLHPEIFSVKTEEFQTTRSGVHPRIRVDATSMRPRFLTLLLPFPAQAGSRTRPRVERLQSKSGAPAARILWADGRIDWFSAGPAAAPDGSTVDADFCWMRFTADGRREQVSASRLRMLSGPTGLVLEAAEPVDLAWAGEEIEVGPGHAVRLRVAGEAAQMHIVELPPPILPLGLPIRAMR
ncbi:MAG TPA: heparinase II/III family protein, partial [Opitutaceae bacterium]